MSGSPSPLRFGPAAAALLLGLLTAALYAPAVFEGQLVTASGGYERIYP